MKSTLAWVAAGQSIGEHCGKLPLRYWSTPQLKVVGEPKNPVRQEKLQVCPVVKLPQSPLKWVGSGIWPVHMEATQVGMLPDSAIWFVPEFQPQLHSCTDEPICSMYPAAQLTKQLPPKERELQLFWVPVVVGTVFVMQCFGEQLGVEPVMEPDPAGSQVNMLESPS